MADIPDVAAHIPERSRHSHSGRSPASGSDRRRLWLRIGHGSPLAVTLVALFCHGTVSAATLDPAAVVAWSRYAAGADARLAGAPPPLNPPGEPIGQSVTVPGGTIHLWRGSTLVRHTTVARLLERLKYPGTPPPQADVLESRVLDRDKDSLHVYLKLVRNHIVTVTYDTEHDVVFWQHSHDAATSRSIATRITEVGGGDRGFLWRLNSYWRYRQAGDDVLVELESLSLSRDIPFLVRPVVAPLVSRIGRESVTRTLAALKRYVEGAGMPYH